MELSNLTNEDAELIRELTAEFEEIKNKGSSRGTGSCLHGT
jgi:hypothetical protein